MSWKLMAIGVIAALFCLSLLFSSGHFNDVQHTRVHSLPKMYDAVGGMAAEGEFGASTERAMRRTPESSSSGDSNKQRVILRTSTVSLQVGNLSTALGHLRQVLASAALFHNSYIASENQYEDNAHLQIKVPSEALDAFVVKLQYLTSDVVVQSISFNSNDVTEEWVDIEARLRVMTASREQYYSLLAKATTVQDVISVQNQIDSLTERIESMLGRRNYLETNAKMSTVSLSIRQTYTPKIQVWKFFAWVDDLRWTPLQQVDRALRFLTVSFVEFANAIIFLVILSAPLVLIAMLVLLCRRRGLCGGKRGSSAIRRE